MKLVYLSSKWPEAFTGSTSLRTVYLLKTLKNLDYEVTFHSIKKPSPSQLNFIESLNIKYGYLATNNPKNLIKSIKTPNICIFESWSIEEIFSRYFFNELPDCKRILNVTSMNCLRNQRKRELDLGKSVKEIKNLEILWRENETQKEIASILRSDLSIFASSYEKKLISNYFPSKPLRLLQYNPESTHLIEDNSLTPLRNHYIWVGNPLKESNFDSIMFTLTQIWPIIHKLTGSEFHIFGPNLEKLVQFKSPGVVLQGNLSSYAEYSKYKCFLSYVRYDSGVNLNIANCFHHHLPVITTSIGAEGIHNFYGLIGDEPEQFAKGAIEVFLNTAKLFKKSDKRKPELLENILEDALKLDVDPIQKILFSKSIASDFTISHFIEKKKKNS